MDLFIPPSYGTGHKGTHISVLLVLYPIQNMSNPLMV